MATPSEKFSELSRTKNYGDQAIWFLNGFWEDGAYDNAEKIYAYGQKMIELDEDKKVRRSTESKLLPSFL